MTTFKKVNRFANRGATAEKAAQKFMEAWAKDHPTREANRLVDAKAAGRIIKAAAADFEFFALPGHGLIEVKETEHEYRLARDKVPQLARLRRRAKCGGICVVAVLHSPTGQWRVLDAAVMAVTGDKGSWDLRGTPYFASIGEALGSFCPAVFL